MIEFAVTFAGVALLTVVAVGIGKLAGIKVADRIIRFADPRIHQRTKSTRD